MLLCSCSPLSGFFLRSFRANEMGRQDLMGHEDLKTSAIHTHVLSHGPMSVRSPAGIP
jgi:hypothetical protein